MNKFMRDLFLESDGDLNRESIAFAVAMFVFLVGQIRGTLGSGRWDPIGFGFTFAAIMIGGAAAAGSKQKAVFAINKLKERMTELEERCKVGS